MSTNICNVYEKLCLKHNISVDELILSSLYNSSVNDELNLKNTTIIDESSFLIAQTLKIIPTIKILNLSDCLLSFNSLKSFLDVVNQLENLSVLNLKGNGIGNYQTTYISKILLNNTSITELRLEWNNIGSSVNTFAELCNSLMSNTILVTLNVANNNLCQACGSHLAKMLNINKCLENIDLSWNNICETGAIFLLNSLKNNTTLTELNIQGNSVSEETSTMIAEHLQQNKANKICKKGDPSRNLHLCEHEISVDNNQEQLKTVNSQYRSRIEELESKLHIIQEENQQQKQTLEELKTNHLKEKESSREILKNMESKLSFQNQSLSSLVKKMSNEVSDSDVENMNSLEDLDKIIYIVGHIKKRHNEQILKETEVRQNILKTLSKLTNELKAIKEELTNFKSSTKLELNDYSDKLTAIQKLLLANMVHLSVSKKISDKIYMKNFEDLQKDINIFDKQAKMLTLLNTNFNKLYEEKTKLEIKLAEAETQFVIHTQTVQELQNSLIMANDEIKKFNEKQLSMVVDQKLNNDELNKNIDIIKTSQSENDQKLRLNDNKINEIIYNYEKKLSTLREQFQLNKQKFEEKKKEDQKQLEELHMMFTQYVSKLKEENSENINNN